MCWEQTGADFICVDESQDFNNLWIPSDDPGMAIGFVHRSIDLEMKFHAIRRRYGSRACLRHRNPRHQQDHPVLRPAAIPAARSGSRRRASPADAPWAATYSEAEQRLEMKADGGFSLVARMRLINFPELLLDLHYFGDFKDADDIGLKRPAIRGGKPEIRGNPAVTELVDYQSHPSRAVPRGQGRQKGEGRRHGSGRHRGRVPCRAGPAAGQGKARREAQPHRRAAEDRPHRR